MSDTIKVACLNGGDSFAETVATIVLAHKKKPQRGRHILPFSLLQEANDRWMKFPGAGLACLKNVDLVKVNMVLTILGSIQVAMVKVTGSLEVLDPQPHDPQPEGDGRQF